MIRHSLILLIGALFGVELSGDNIFSVWAHRLYWLYWIQFSFLLFYLFNFVNHCSKCLSLCPKCVLVGQSGEIIRPVNSTVVRLADQHAQLSLGSTLTAVTNITCNNPQEVLPKVHLFLQKPPFFLYLSLYELPFSLYTFLYLIYTSFFKTWSLCTCR